MLQFGPERFVSALTFKDLKMKVQRTINFPAVLYGCEISSLTLREEKRLRAFEN